jgi:hypothetical protein
MERFPLAEFEPSEATHHDDDSEEARRRTIACI